MKGISLLLGSLLFTLHMYGQVYQDYLGNGHMQGIQVSSSDESDPATAGIQTLNGFPGEEQIVLTDVSRFLAQASFGANYPTIQAVAAQGFEGWLQEQMHMEPTYLMPTLRGLIAWEIEQEEDEDDEEEEEEDIIFEAYRDHFRSAWFHTAMTAPDQLRQRVALALSEILVISDNSDELFDSGYGLTSYYDMLVRNAFGNYRQLLMEVSLHPTMGFYLSHLNNPRTDTANNIFPDENYAREIMQLFTIGLYELNPDGTYKLDAAGNRIPTYDNADIDEFAKVFTGLAGTVYRNGQAASFPSFFEELDHRVPMKMYDAFHEPGPKRLLNGYVIPAGQPGFKDVQDAVKHLFDHPNVGPFIARRLIQRLVTANPTPAYIQRVASVFADNGQGVRGDLGAVVRAILLDAEARACDHRVENPHRAMLREPLIRHVHFCRALDVFPYNSLPYFLNPGYRLDFATGQMPLSATTVFNFFLPDYQPSGIISAMGLFGPVFQIHNSTTAINYANEVDVWTFLETPISYDDPYEAVFEGFESEPQEFSLARLPLNQLIALANTPSELLDRLDLLFTHGQMSEGTYDILLQAINSLDDPRERVHMGLYLTFISPDYTILN